MGSLVGRAALALLSLWMLSIAVRRFDVFLKESAGTFHFNGATWLTWLVATLAAGFLFGLAAWLPFTSVRYVPSRLLLAALVLLPLARFWWVTIQGHGGSVHWLTATN